MSVKFDEHTRFEVRVLHGVLLRPGEWLMTCRRSVLMAVLGLHPNAVERVERELIDAGSSEVYANWRQPLHGIGSITITLANDHGT